MSKIKALTKANPPFFCKDIKAVLKDNDRLLKEIEEIGIKNKKDFEEE